MQYARSPLARLGLPLVAGAGLVLALGCGASIASDTSLSSVPTTPGGWLGPVPLETSLTLNSTQPSVAMDASDNVLGVWQKASGGSNGLFGNIFLASADAWQIDGDVTPSPVPTSSSQHGKVAVDGYGHFFYAFDLSQSSTDSEVWVNQWSYANGMSAPLRLDAGYGYSPSLAMNASGDACVAWMEQGPTYMVVQACRYSGATGVWGAPVQISTTSTANALTPKVGIDDGGNAVVLWTESVNTQSGPYTLQAATFLASAGSWSMPGSPQAGSLSDSAYALAMTGGGAQIAWAESADSGATWVIKATRWTPSNNAWSTVAQVSASGGVALVPALAQDSSGNAMLVWTSGATVQAAAPSLYSASFSPSSGWQTPQALVTGAVGIQSPKLAMNISGDGALTWKQNDGTYWRIAASLLEPGSGWATPAFIQTATGGNADAPDIFVSSSGAIVAAWSQLDATGLSHIYGNIYP